MKSLILFIAFMCPLVFYSCGASTADRYSDDEEKIKEKEIEEVKEDFDFTPYQTKLEIPEKKINLPSHSKNQDVWYDYDEKNIDTLSSSQKIVSKLNGYRVLIFTTDNLDEANNMRSEIYFKTTEKQVYVTFDPPFYKVTVGDFTNYSDAKNLSFKLKQMGYAEARVVNETINIFE